MDAMEGNGGGVGTVGWGGCGAWGTFYSIKFWKMNHHAF